MTTPAAPPVRKPSPRPAAVEEALVAATDQQPRFSQHQLAALRWSVAGLLIGASWAWNAGQPPWEHAVKLLLLILIVPSLWHRARVRKQKKTGIVETGPHLSLRKLVVAKVGLVAVALAVSASLDGHLAGYDYWIAGGLVAVVAIGGTAANDLFLG